MRDLAAVLFRPRRVMARVLEEGPRAGQVWLLFVLAAVSGVFGDFDAPMLGQVLDHSRGPRVALTIAGVLVGLIVLLPVLFWFYAYVPYLIGRFLGGTGDVRGVRAATAWGLAPVIWALLYRIPAAIWLAPSFATNVRMRGGNVAFDPGALAGGCGVALVLVFVELLVFIWCVVITSNTLSEAHRFSVWHAFGTVVLSAIAPLVVVLAAVLAMM